MLLAVAVIASAVLSLSFCPVIIKVCEKLNWYDEVDPRKIHKGKVPRLGGIAVFSSFFIVWIIVTVYTDSRTIVSFAPLLFSFCLILFFGVIDDIFNMRAKNKLLIQMLAALIVSVSPHHFHSLLSLSFPPVVGELVTFIWIISLVNAFNLIDGMDWLCGGISFFICIALGIVYKVQNNSIYIFYFILSSSLLGFLFWNRPNARIFLGDGGSQTLGFLVAVAPLFNRGNVKFEFLQFPLMVLLCSIPITDVIAAIWRRIREHRALFSPDRSHIHHKLLNVGFSKPAAIFFLLTLQFLISLAVVVSSFMTQKNALALVGFSILFVWGIFTMFHYLNRAVNIAHKGLLEDHQMKEH